MITKEQFSEQYHKLQSLEKVAKFFGLTSHQARKLQEQFGLHPKTADDIIQERGFTKELLSKLYTEDNLEVEDIAKRLDTTLTVVKRCLVVFNVKKVTFKKDKEKVSKEQLLELYRQNLSTKEIAEKLGCSTVTVNRLFKKYDIERPTLKQQISKETLKKLYLDNNMSMEEIAQELKVSTSLISQLLREYNLSKTTLKSILTKEVLEELYVKQKLTTKQIADRFHIDNMSTVSNLASTYGVDISSPLQILLSKLTKESLEKLFRENNWNSTKVADILGVSEPLTMKAFYAFKLRNPTSTTKPEREIAEFLTNLEIKFTQNDSNLLKDLELDFICEDQKVAIEYNGIPWHSELYVDKNYHSNKSLKALEKGYFVYHIFSYEWEDKRVRPIIESQLRNLLGRNQIKIFARKCNIKEVSSLEKKHFLLDNHIQGDCRSSINLGLYYKDELVSLMTFDKPRMNFSFEWELVRFCSRKGTNVIGGANKLFNFFIQNYQPVSVLSYSDKAKTKGKLYEKLGFKEEGTSPAGYVWSNGSKTLKRYQCQKKRLLEKGLGTEQQTEVEIMRSLGFYRVFDCGNTVWSWHSNILSNFSSHK